MRAPQARYLFPPPLPPPLPFLRLIVSCGGSTPYLHIPGFVQDFVLDTLLLLYCCMSEHSYLVLSGDEAAAMGRLCEWSLWLLLEPDGERGAESASKDA